MREAAPLHFTAVDRSRDPESYLFSTLSNIFLGITFPSHFLAKRRMANENIISYLTLNFVTILYVPFFSFLIIPIVPPV